MFLGCIEFISKVCTCTETYSHTKKNIVTSVLISCDLNNTNVILGEDRSICGTFKSVVEC